LGRLFVVATAIGNLSDISERARETLVSVALVAAEDTRRTLGLLAHFSIKTPAVSYHKFNEEGRGRELIEKILREDIDVALVSDAGTPCISDPGCAVVRMAREAGIEVVGIPGPCAAVTALSVCGFIFDSFMFMGFIPREKKEREEYFNTLSEGGTDTFVLYESPNRIRKSLREISRLLPGSEVFAVNDMTKFYERAYRGSAEEVAAALEAEEKSGLGEYTVVLNRKRMSKEDGERRLSAEALLADEMARSGCTLREAVEAVCAGNADIGKNEAYRASLRLKSMFGEPE